MAEPLSITASVAGLVGLADVALRGSKELYAFFSALKDAPQHVKSLTTELENLNNILSEIQGFSSDYCQSEFVVRDGLKLKGHLTALIMTQENVSVLSKTIKPMEPNASQGRIKQLQYQFRWVSMKDQLERLGQELSRHQHTLLTTLSLCGLQNEIQIRKKQRAVEKSLFGHQTLALRHHNTLSAATEKAVQSSKGSLDAIRGLEMTQDRGFEAVQASFSAQKETMIANTQLIRQDNSTIQEQIMKVHDFTRDAHVLMNQKIEEMVAFTVGGKVGEEERNDWDFHVMGVDVESLTLSILLMKENLRGALHTICCDHEQRHLVADFIWSEINQLLVSSLEASASLVKNQSENYSLQEDSVCEYDGPRLVPRPFKRKRSTEPHLRLTPSGLLSIETNYAATKNGENMFSARVTFIPTVGSCKVGFIAHFSVSVQNATYQTPSRQLSIIDIVPHEYSHPGAWEAVPKNVIRAMQRPLSGYTDAPFDDLDDATTMLWVCPSRFWRRVRRMIDHSAICTSQFVQRSRDIIMARCGSVVLSMVRERRGTIETAPPLFIAETTVPASNSDLCIGNLSTRSPNEGDSPTPDAQLEDDITDHVSEALDVLSMTILLSSAEMGMSQSYSETPWGPSLEPSHFQIIHPSIEAFDVS